MGQREAYGCVQGSVSLGLQLSVFPFEVHVCLCVDPSFWRYYPDFLRMRVNAVCPPHESRSCGNLLYELVSGRKDGAQVLE